MFKIMGSVVFIIGLSLLTLVTPTLALNKGVVANGVMVSATTPNVTSGGIWINSTTGMAFVSIDGATWDRFANVFAD